MSKARLQTRKWTDQSGAEKYSTEIVISRFKGELTLLDGRGEGGGFEAGPSGESDYGAPRSAPSRAPANAGGGGGGGGGWEPPADLDDEIPF